MTDQEIHEICEKHEIENYKVNNDLVDVDGNVDLSKKNLSKLPLKFGTVNGYFYCDNNQLKSLKGAPNKVNGGFYCFNNQIITLEGSPNKVNGDFNCFNNQLTTLKHLPDCKEVYFHNNPCYNKLKDLSTKQIINHYKLKEILG